MIGTFTGDGRLTVVDSDANGGPEQIIDLDTAFLHDGRPQRVMTASTTERTRNDRRPPPADRSVPNSCCSIFWLTPRSGPTNP